MSTYQKRKAAGLCVKCGKAPPEEGKTKCLPCAEAQREHWKKWAAENPDKAQENRDKWAKTPKGEKAMKRAVKRRRGTQSKYNKRRREWRKERDS